MWTETTQPQYRRDGLRYASDVTDTEWALIENFVPAPKKLGRPRTTAMREVVNALLYLLTTGCQWRLLPKEFPPFSTVQRFFYRWRNAGLWQTINHSLVMRVREAAGREASLERRESSTASRSRPAKPPVPAAMTPARRSRGASATCLPTPTACWSQRWSMRLISKTVTGRRWCWPPRVISIPGCAMSSP